MHRLFGTSKPQEPKPTIDDAISKADSQIAKIKEKIDGYNTELSKFQKQLSGMREGPGKNAVRQRATRVLQQRKLYEQQLNQIEQQAFNMESAKFTSENLQSTLTTIKTMEQTNKTLKKQYKGVDIDKIYRLQDELADIMEETNEIQEVMGRSYNVPDTVDEADLDAELEALGTEWNFEQEEKSNKLPSYLDDGKESLPNTNSSELEKELEEIANNPQYEQPAGALIGESSK